MRQREENEIDRQKVPTQLGKMYIGQNIQGKHKERMRVKEKERKKEKKYGKYQEIWYVPTQKREKKRYRSIYRQFRKDRKKDIERYQVGT